MFETQDTLPRAPPMPCAPILPGNTAVMKPAVPEVSIIMGPPTKPQTAAQPEGPVSYAAWKNQILPRAKYSPNMQDDNMNEQPIQSAGFMTTRSTVYPMRTKATTIAVPPPQAMETVPVYRRSLENPLQPQIVPAQRPTQNVEHRRSVDSLPQRSQANEHVLTICASTQTDSAMVSPENNLTQQLIAIVKELQDEQRQMRRLLETILIQQQQQQQQPMQTATKVYCREVATQCDIQVLSCEEDDTLHQALPNVKIYSANLKDTPHADKPSAYHPTNVNQIAGFSMPPANQYQGTQLPKPNTEKSMVMNELALKYLPSEKINELMQDMAISAAAVPAAKAATPLREIDNFNKTPVDISNASYKYLRKYRLLPDQNATPPPLPAATPQNGMHTPYQQRGQDSPLICSNNGSVETENGSPHLDLEHIRRQPKFL